MRMVLTAFLFVFGVFANAAACDGGDAAVRFGTAETGVGIAAGVAVGLHGCDQAAAGCMKMISASDYDTFTSRGMQGLGVPRDVANIADAGISMVGTAGIGVVSRASAAAAYRNVGANGPIQGAESTLTEIVHRWMPQTELDATRNTGLMRGGRSGTHYVTNAGNHNPSRARLRLALDHTPEVRVKLEVPAGVFSGTIGSSACLWNARRRAGANSFGDNTCQNYRGV